MKLLYFAALGAVALSIAAAGQPALASTSADPLPVQLSLEPVNQPQAYFDLVLEPGQSGQFEVELSNHGAESITARTYAADVFTIVNGGFGAEDRDGEPSGTTTWLSYPTEVLELRPQQANIRTFSVTVPADTQPGQYITGLVLENEEPIGGTGEVALSQVIRQAVAVSIRIPGPTEPLLEIGTASHAVTAARSVVDVEVSNPGEENLKPAGAMTIRDSSGTTVSEAPIVMGSVYARDQTRVQTTLAGTLEPGDYTVDITLTDPDTGATSTQTEVPFTVTVEEVAANSAEPGALPHIAQGGAPDVVPYLVGGGVVGGALAVTFLTMRIHARWKLR